MLGKIASFEFRYHLLSPASIAIFSIFFLFCFGISASDQIQLGNSNTVNVNSPSAITLTMLVFSTFGMIIPTVFLASGILRDRNFKTQELFYTTQVKERDYLLGRFIGGFLITCLVLTSIPLGHLIGSLMPWLDPETLGPFNANFYLQPYLVIGVANMLIIGMIVFTAANLSRSLMITWVTLVGLFIFNTIGGFLTTLPEWRTFAALTDPFGGNAVIEMTRYWTPADQNTQLVPLEGLFLQNRLIWMGVAIALFVFNILIFSFRLSNSGGKKKARRSETPFTPTAIELPITTPTLDMAVWQQFWARVGFEVKGVVFNIAFWILLLFGIILVSFSVFISNPVYGTPSYPLTQVLINSMIGGFVLVPLVVVIYYASELMWRERNVKFSDIVDATPAPSWVFMTAKLAGMFTVIVGLLSVAVLITIGSQAVRGYFNFELDQYLVRTVFDLVIPLTMLSMLAIFLQVLMNNKWLGIVAIGAIFIITAFVLDNVGLNHSLYQFPFVTNTPYSDMNGFGHFMGIRAWYHLYWGGVMLFLFVLASVLWNRGALMPVWQRLVRLPRSFTPATAGLALVSLVAAGGAGSWIYYNTTVLNDYTSNRDAERQTAEFEREWRDQLEGVAQPTITAVDFDVDIYPDERRYTARGQYTLENQTSEAISTVWAFYGTDEINSHDLGGVIGELRHDGANLYAYDLDEPMQPGEVRTLHFDVAVSNPGFRNSGNVTQVNYNGSFFNNGSFAPTIGFTRNVLLQDPSVRRRNDLPELDRSFDINDESRWNEHSIRQDSDFVDFRSTVSTSEDQIAVAPGYLQREWTENGRRYFEYEMDVPILNFFNWMSADYTLLEEEVDGILYQVFYHEDHAWNVERMMEAAQDSIAYFSQAFSPYQYRQYRMFEFPAYATFAQSFPNTIAYSEAIGFTADLRDEDNIDYVYYVTAHEAAHQWWAHQVMSANVQGGTMLVETFAQYSALMVMEQEYGPDQMRRFLKYELDAYLGARGNESREELPLYLVENQQYIHYRKGAVIMYALQDYMGEEVVNRAMARLIEEFQYSSEPYARSADFLRILREEAGPEFEQIIHDFFERIVLFDLSIDTEDNTFERRQLEDGRWETTFTVLARKFEADGQGNETEEPIDYGIDIGVFTRSLNGAIEGTDHILYFERHQITQAETEFSIITDEEPAWVGIDPYNKLIDRNSDDNLAQPPRAEDVSEQAESEAEEETALLIGAGQ